MKRTLSLVLALVMVLGSFTTVFAAVETQTAADFLAEKGVLKGADGDLMLDKNLERRDAVVLLSRLLGAESEAKTFLTTEDSPSWEDARTDAYYVPFFAWAEANGYFAGDDEGNFNPRNPITAQEYALVLARALEYELDGHEPWAAALAIAKELGLLEGVEVEDKDEVVRGDMAVMTFNTLNAKVNGSDQTLAEKLGIEMPAEPKPENLEVEVYSENLREIIVELNDASLVDEIELLEKDNYRIVKNTVERVTLDGNQVIVELKNSLDIKDEYELIIGGNDRDFAGRYTFIAHDDTVPTVEKVEVLGEYGIKVTVSEPVDIKETNTERHFLVDGKNIAMNIESHGRVLILTPYHSASFSLDAEELEVRGLEDYAGFKSSRQIFDLEVEKDEVAPEVVKVELIDGNIIEVTFDKDIYKNSVTGNVSTRVLGNVSYNQGRQTIYTRRATTTTNYGSKVDLNKAQYEFVDALPRNAEITIEGVQNHSKVKMEAVTERVTEKIDRLQPEILDVDFWKSGTVADPVANFDIYFNKNVIVGSGVNKAAAARHFGLYIDSVANKNLVDADDYTIEYDYHEDKDVDARYHNVVTVSITGLEYNVSPNYEYDYILEIKNFEDNSILKNRMYVDYYDFEVTKSATGFDIEGMNISHPNRVETELSIKFSRPVNRAIAEDGTNYIFKTATTRKDVVDLKGEVEVEDNGYTVTIIIPTTEYNKYKDNGFLDVLEVLKATNGLRLDGTRTYDFALNSFVHLRADAYTNLVAAIEKAEAFVLAVASIDGTVDLTTLNAKILAAKTVRDNLDASEKDYNDQVKALEEEMAEGKYAAGEIAELAEFFEDAEKVANIATAVRTLAASQGSLTEAEFLQKVADAILAELKDGAEELGKAGSAKATINGLEVIVKTELVAGKVKYTISIAGKKDVTGTVNVTFVEKTFKLSFAVTGPETVTIDVYNAEAGRDGVFNLVAGTYDYTISAAGYVTETGTVTLKEDTEVKVELKETEVAGD